MQETITVETLQKMLAQGEPVTLLDIRPANERAEWAIPGSLHRDAYEALKANDPEALAGLELPADRPVVAICGAGKTSLTAAQQLRGRGFQAFSLEGGMKAWSLAWNVAEVSLAGSAARVIQVRRTGKGCLSYLVGANGQAAVFDPALASEVYLDLARSYGWTINYVLETHIHADHLSRGRQLAEQCGAALYLPDQQRLTYPFLPLHNGDELNIGGVRLVALHAPGHTWESTCYWLDDQALFTGDTLFLQGVGRPDLEANADEARSRGRSLYRSLQEILKLPAATKILPGHTSQPVAFNGQAIVASLDQVRQSVDLLGEPEETFVELLLARIPPTPPNHQRIVELNEAGVWLEGDPTELEAGANRCAIS